ncbi:MAG: GNAT family N-acetyltransferase [Alphaproteobacteria bacterium]|nr:GNAT family N-acetyltransferase [Alphaproteobacteria bacterium]
MARAGPLSGRRLALMPFGPEHLNERYVGWLNDPQVVRWSEQRHRRHDLSSCQAYAERFAQSPDYFWAIVANDPALGHVGNLTATLDPPNGVADLAILIGDKAAWGKGLGGEAFELACRFLLLERGLRKVTAGTAMENAGMLAIMRKLGMRPDGRRVRQLVIDGREMDVVHAALFAADLRPPPLTGSGRRS